MRIHQKGASAAPRSVENPMRLGGLGATAPLLCLVRMLFPSGGGPMRHDPRAGLTHILFWIALLAGAVAAQAKGGCNSLASMLCRDG